MSDRGSSTVFLTMVFGITLVLIVSLISVLRFRWEKVQIVRSGRISVESEFGKYYRPLYDSYRMFYYVEGQERQLEAGITSYFMKNQEEMPQILALTPSYVDITEKIYAVDNAASNVEQQILDNAVYSNAENFFENMVYAKDEDDTLEKAREEICELKEQAYVDEMLLNLLNIVEGITLDGGKVKCLDHFAKEIIFEDIKPSHVGVDSDIVWGKMKRKYKDASKFFEKLTTMTESAIAGKKVAYFSKEIGTWKNVFTDVKRKMSKAYDIVTEIKKHLNKGKNAKMICDVDSFEIILKSNMEILDELIIFTERKKPSEKSEWTDYYNELKRIEDIVDTYQIKELRFDYSCMLHEECVDPRDKAPKGESGILDLLIDDSVDISSKGISESDVYIKLMKDEISENDMGIYMFDDDFDRLAEFVSECGKFMRQDAEGQKDNNKLMQKAKIISYSNLYFDSFLKNDVSKVKEHLLEYEKEYFVAGEISDRENLREVAIKLLMTRTGRSMIYLLKSEDSKIKAYKTAISLVGFSGMDALVKCVQYSILAAWAYEDACVDVASLLSGKNISYIKKGLNIDYTELLEFGEELVKRKVQENNPGNGIGYDELLDSMIFTQKKSNTLYRIMDLIQYNMKINFSSKFSFLDAVYGAKVAIGCCKPYESSIEVVYEYE